MSRKAFHFGDTWLLALAGITGLLSSGCDNFASLSPDVLVVTLAPASNSSLPPPPNPDYLDIRYPFGCRVVLLQPFPPAITVTTTNRVQVTNIVVKEELVYLDLFKPIPGILRVLSDGLLSAGAPVVTPNGKRVFFTGKANAHSAWQVYEANLEGGRPLQITEMPGGAMTPAILPGGALVFSSPVPQATKTWAITNPAALYAMSPGRPPTRLTFGLRSAVDPTILSDGRILFVSAITLEYGPAPHIRGLFTINKDGTGVTRIVGGSDGYYFSPGRPRELPARQIGFIAFGFGQSQAYGVSMVNPQIRHEPYFSGVYALACYSVEPDGPDAILGCFARAATAVDVPGNITLPGIYRVTEGKTQTITALWHKPADGELPLEAVPLRARPVPTSQMSTIATNKQTGTILCCDFNIGQKHNYHDPAFRAQYVRVLIWINGKEEILGEIPLEPDGSFIAEVPADQLIGFETLSDAQLSAEHQFPGLQRWRSVNEYRQPPSLWVRPGEFRSCVGCHESSGQAPRNVHPMAANKVPPLLTLPGRRITNFKKWQPPPVQFSPVLPPKTK